MKIVYIFFCKKNRVTVNDKTVQFLLIYVIGIFFIYFFMVDDIAVLIVM